MVGSFFAYWLDLAARSIVGERAVDEILFLCRGRFSAMHVSTGRSLARVETKQRATRLTPPQRWPAMQCPPLGNVTARVPAWAKARCTRLGVRRCERAAVEPAQTKHQQKHVKRQSPDTAAVARQCLSDEARARAAASKERLFPPHPGTIDGIPDGYS